MKIARLNNVKDGDLLNIHKGGIIYSGKIHICNKFIYILTIREEGLYLNGTSCNRQHHEDQKFKNSYVVGNVDERKDLSSKLSYIYTIEILDSKQEDLEDQKNEEDLLNKTIIYI